MPAIDDPSAHAQATALRWAQRWIAVVDPLLRIARLDHDLVSGEARTWVYVLRELVRVGAGQGPPVVRAAVEAFVLARVRATLPYHRHAEVYAAARDAELDVIARLFVDPAAALLDRQATAALSPERAVQPRGRELSLGERKGLARTHRRDLLTVIARDPHPDVIAIALDNRQLVEADVVRIAATTHAHPAGLRAVAGHPRWSPRHLVKRALCHNPATPIGVRFLVATTLPGRDLREVAAAPTFDLAMRQHAAQILALTSG